MHTVVVNSENLDFRNALGVVSFTINLCAALSKSHKVIYAVNNEADREYALANEVIASTAKDVILLSDAQSVSAPQGSLIEFLPHHFQLPKLYRNSALVCHDLHVFDIPWKYNKVREMQAQFRKNIETASVVVTHFPRTYYALERVAKARVKRLFLTESPLMLDTSAVGAATKRRLEAGQLASDPNRTKTFIYPAQLQKHKNHLALFDAIAELKRKGVRVNMLCSGTDFEADFTRELRHILKEKDLADDVKLIGRITDQELCDLYESCDGVVIPSLAEGGAYVALEAIAAGKPVAVNDIPSARMHIESVAGKAILFNANDGPAFVAALEALIATDAAQNWAANALARERISAMTWARIADRWSGILDVAAGRAEMPRMLIDKDGWNIDYKTSGTTAAMI